VGRAREEKGGEIDVEVSDGNEGMEEGRKGVKEIDREKGLPWQVLQDDVLMAR